ncbi:MAG TPA: hypothetical protein VKF62_02305, partial [Planctomycetota bacterium]|nr:hypothetical protein [Planctomycetota bacterium]
LRIPYAFLATPWPWSHLTSPARGGRLVSIHAYASMVALDPARFRENDGEDPARPPHYQEPVWGAEGGSVFHVLPPAHMRHIRWMGERCLAEAEQGLALAGSRNAAAVHARDLMNGLQLLSAYYEEKVGAATSALIHARGRRAEDRREAEERADRALESYRRVVEFMRERLDPYFRDLVGAPMTEAGVPLERLLELETEDRRQLPVLFRWTEEPP